MVTSDQALELLVQQQAEWDMARENYSALKNVRVKELDFGSYRIKVQFNPARITSSAAKVDAKSIQARKCFLCKENLPPVQRGIPFNEEYQVLINPFPIFPQHLTIPILEHKDQLIHSRFEDMLDLAEALEDFVIFYNGPKCGASAPDHMHFQAGNKGFLPLEKEWKSVDQEMIYMKTGISLYVLKNYLRNTLIIESKNKEYAVNLFNQIYELLEVKEGEKEPMMNIVSWYEKGWWITALFPREQHRPTCYWEEGEKNILISPASVDMGGVFITPLEKDFDKMGKEEVKAIMEEVSLSDVKMDKLLQNLTNRL